MVDGRVQPGVRPSSCVRSHLFSVPQGRGFSPDVPRGPCSLKTHRGPSAHPDPPPRQLSRPRLPELGGPKEGPCVPAVGLPSQVFTEHLLRAEVAGVLCGGTGRRNRGVWGVQPRGGQEKEVVYSLNKHLCFKHLARCQQSPGPQRAVVLIRETETK